MMFRDREAAGQQLAGSLAKYRGKDVVVYALPRGGVVLGAEVAKDLHAPLDLLIARKVGHPLSSEYAIGAVTEMGEPVWNKWEASEQSASWREEQVRLAKREAYRRRIKYQGDQPTTEVKGKVAIVVDDGVATGLTLIAALKDLTKRHPKKIVVAVPVATAELSPEILDCTDELVVLYVPSHLGSIGAYYENFDQVSDEEVRQLMDAYRAAPVSEPLDLENLNTVVATVTDYPVTSKQLAGRAKRLHAPSNVVAFFESISPEIRFENKTDIMKRSEESKLLTEEEPGQPEERLRSYDS